MPPALSLLGLCSPLAIYASHSLPLELPQSHNSFYADPAQVIDRMLADPVLGKHLKNPSVSYGFKNLYAHGIYEVGFGLHTCVASRTLC